MQPVPDDTGYWETFAAEQQSGGRDDCIPHFYMRAVRNPARSEAEGRPVFDEAAYVRVLVPGDRNSVVDRRVGDADRERWPRRWAAFLARRERPSGKPHPVPDVRGATGWCKRRRVGHLGRSGAVRRVVSTHRRKRCCQRAW